MNTVKKCWERFGADHVVFCFEGRSWRKDFYTQYKANRKETRDAMTPAEQEADKLFWETFDEFKNFVKCEATYNPPSWNPPMGSCSHFRSAGQAFKGVQYGNKK